MLTPADQVWNRAALNRGGPSPREGDMHLVALSRLHGIMMNGGLDHAIETLTTAQYSQGVAGYRFIGMDAAADILEAAAIAGEEEIEAADHAYNRLVPTDATITEFYESTYARVPNLFAPT